MLMVVSVALLTIEIVLSRRVLDPARELFSCKAYYVALLKAPVWMLFGFTSFRLECLYFVTVQVLCAMVSKSDKSTFEIRQGSGPACQQSCSSWQAFLSGSDSR